MWDVVNEYIHPSIQPASHPSIHPSILSTSYIHYIYIYVCIMCIYLSIRPSVCLSKYKLITNYVCTEHILLLVLVCRDDTKDCLSPTQPKRKEVGEPQHDKIWTFAFRHGSEMIILWILFAKENLTLQTLCDQKVSHQGFRPTSTHITQPSAHKPGKVFRGIGQNWFLWMHDDAWI